MNIYVEILNDVDNTKQYFEITKKKKNNVHMRYHLIFISSRIMFE